LLKILDRSGKQVIEIIADLHIHTVASGHAGDTIRKNCEFAIKKGLSAIGITDHGPGLPGGASFVYFYTLPRITAGIDLPIKIFSCVEEDIVNKKGELSLPSDCRDRLDIVMAGCHPRTWIARQNVKTRTSAVVNAITKGYIRVLTHPYRRNNSIELKPVLEAAAAAGTALELNTSKPSDRPVILDFLEKCVGNRNHIIVGSDAHVAEEVGTFSEALNLLEESGFPHELVINRTKESIESFFGVEWK
jgi:putative hydrolase